MTTHFPGMANGAGHPAASQKHSVPSPAPHAPVTSTASGTWKYADKMYHPGNPIVDRLVPFKRYTMEIRKFLSLNMSQHTQNGVARTVFVHGPPGGGKTEGAIAAALQENFSVMVASASDFASETENGASDVLTDMLKEMEAFSRATGRPVLLLVNDLHLSIMTADDKTGKTVNSGLLADCFMNLADNRHLYRNVDGSNIAFIVTLNDGSKLPESIKREGRALHYEHVPSFEDKKNIAYAILQPQTSAERELVEAVTKRCRHQPVSFWHALKLQIQSKNAERVLRNGIPSMTIVNEVYGRRVTLEADVVWACVKSLRTNHARIWLKKRFWGRR